MCEFDYSNSTNVTSFNPSTVLLFDEFSLFYQGIRPHHCNIDSICECEKPQEKSQLLLFLIMEYYVFLFPKMDDSFKEYSNTYGIYSVHFS